MFKTKSYAHNFVTIAMYFMRYQLQIVMSVTSMR